MRLIKSCAVISEGLVWIKSSTKYTAENATYSREARIARAAQTSRWKHKILHIINMYMESTIYVLVVQNIEVSYESTVGGRESIFTRDTNAKLYFFFFF